MADLAGGGGAMDLRLAERAARRGLQVKGMETWDTLLPVLQKDEWSAESLDALVLSAREADEGRDMQTTSARLYAEERVWPIWTFGIWRAERAGRDIGAEEVRELLFDERNRRFVAAALPELERGGAFVLAGALHLGGDQGMVRLLRGHGFTVERASLR
ncbi:MAG: TraB/GumN family protein, partial [Albimonas sp.]|uniref:TraB/GumN family protein n=1 Tax=Albimonas sp. TaxID=1872425 RepID=UPI0040562039